MPDPVRVPARPRVVVTRRLPAGTEARMTELFDTILSPDDEAMNAAALTGAMADTDVLVPTISDRIDAAVIAAAGPHLRLIASFGAGIDHIDLAAARARGIVVTNTPGVLTEDTADMAMALILSVPRRIAEAQALIRSGDWHGWNPTMLLGHRIGGKRLGIIGLGRIGQAIASRARAFGLSIDYHGRHRAPAAVEEALGATWHADLDTMLPKIDIVSINCPHTRATHHLLDVRRLSLLGPHVCLVNIARGEIVDEGALVAALESGALAGAGLDVFEHEPAIDPRLLALPNVMLLPHVGSATIEGRAATGDKVIANIRAWADGHRPPDQVLEGWA